MSGDIRGLWEIIDLAVIFTNPWRWYAIFTDGAIIQWRCCLLHGTFKGCGMGPWLVLVSPCFRENVVATCKIGSFLCIFTIQKRSCSLFWKSISKWRSFEKRAIFDLLFTFSSHKGKVTKIPSAHISNTYIHVFCSPYWFFLPHQFWKKIWIFQVWFLFGMSPGFDSYSRHFGTINK